MSERNKSTSSPVGFFLALGLVLVIMVVGILIAGLIVRTVSMLT